MDMHFYIVYSGCGASKQIGQLYSPCTSLLLNPDGASKQTGQQYCPPCTSKWSNPDGAMDIH
jgi:hypothetical protein